jgi:hypothetical protein
LQPALPRTLASLARDIGPFPAFADFFPGEALKPSKRNLTGQSVAVTHCFIEEQSGFGPHEIAMSNLVFGLRVERFLQIGIFALRFADGKRNNT